MKKIKCIKCGLRFKDREDPKDDPTKRVLCWNCRFVWECIVFGISSVPEEINRNVSVRLSDVNITKKKKYL